MTQQRRFTKKFAEEAVRLVQTSGRIQREIAGDLGIGLSTLVRWIGRSPDRHAVDPAVSRRRKASRRRASVFRDRLAAGAWELMNGDRLAAAAGANETALSCCLWALRRQPTGNCRHQYQRALRGYAKISAAIERRRADTAVFRGFARP